ncbi:sodium ABC transporter ATP-binding protein [Lactiplantibacillus pentosus]|uniref:ABC superfamily ATP binding cassette transporter, ABC protein n=1 Tax=Lactiplantibacillus pentosus IG1 TaxID=1042160 RepID=G0M655_LACPE|nr:ABC transporter ATP-binding protein [Lactiplantibacillus pentosus]CCC17777.1 ABC superfamily ATP binding cassette transporter, ABC protein [Lactiplantibacillus pentosus IG1]MCT3283522.1 ATP-binding cassette domain-containing protein [Lactiplantibacillus pentosus]MCT3302353.1 ATP-binding cassette domain-containing protein [Lactiplantibacillus pentosus]PRO79194.1 sodium ABC transporter ATP-binding protein [Lactiplantibacillus pentosus]PRO81660.1 sodium ABC transporter ATP-binding protein [Lac
MLSITHIHKRFGDVQALNDVTFDVHDGEIVGLIGQNGAGKSTTFHSILNFLSFEGQITWNGQPLTAADYDQIGYLPEERSLMSKLTITQQIVYLARLKNQPAKVIKPKIASWMARFAVKGQPTDKIDKLSKGNQQKVQLICTLIHEPKLIILDEPFSGLDPVNADLLKQAILGAKQRGAAIIFSSHDMSNVEAICDSLVMLRNGETVLKGTIDDVRAQFGRTRLFLTTDWSADQLAALPGVTGVSKQGARRYRLELASADVGPSLFDQVTGGHYIEEFSQQPPTLDEIFRTEAGGGQHE